MQIDNIEQFNDPEVCKQYLKFHGVEVESSTKEDMEKGIPNYYTLYWKHGFVGMMPTNHGRVVADQWACVFCYSWMNKTGFEAAEDVAWKFVGPKLKSEEDK